MNDVKQQYEAFPYPERNPQDEKRRLITGSPSHPVEIDHFCFGGTRDWSKPFKALVAGGGTGDGLIQLAQMLSLFKRPYEITYLDLSTASRSVAEKRAAMRQLKSLRFLTGSLLDAPEYGPFDYIDCCGVLHHLPDPDAGFAALRAALAPAGALGFMVYAPYGRSGVYPLQDAFGALLANIPPKQRLAKAKSLVAALPEAHPFKRNILLSDHNQSDAGFYDLLLHSQDRAYDVRSLLNTLDRTDWQLASFVTPALYDLGRIADVPETMALNDQMAVAEQLHGTLRMHVAYAVPKGDTRTQPRGTNHALVPHLRGVDAAALARRVASGKPVPISHSGVTAKISLPKDASSVIAGINGHRTIAEIAKSSRLDPMRFGAVWSTLDREFVDWGVMLYSSIQRN